MTVQVSDQLKYNSKTYELLQEDGDPFLFNPLKYGFDIYNKSSDCFKGHISTYAIKNNYLVLDRLEVNSTKKVNLNNIKPNKGILMYFISKLKIWKMIGFDYIYKNINLRINYTGEILIGFDEIACDFDDNYYYENYVLSPHSFKEVIKLEFVKGRVVNVTDISKDMIKLRELLEIKYKSKYEYEYEEEDFEDFINTLEESNV